MSKSLSGNYLFNLLNTISGMLFPIITFPYVTRVLGAENIGQLNFYNSIIAYVVLLSGLGIATYASREIAIVRDDKLKMQQKSIEILLLHATLTLLGYIAVFIISISIDKVQDNLPLFWLLSLNLIFTAIGCEWLYIAFEDFKYIAIRGFIIKLVCVVLLFIFVKSQDDLIYYGIYTVLGSLGGNLINFFRLSHYLDYHLINWKELHIFQHLWPSIKIFGLSLITSIYLNLDTVMLGFLADNESVAYYTSATKLSKMMMAFTTSITVILLPRLSNMVGKSDMVAFTQLVNKSYKYVFLISLPMAVGLFSLAEPLILIFCGDKYLPAISCLRIISPVLFLISVSYLICQTFYPLGKLKYMYYPAITAAITNLILNYCFIPILQEDGAAIATVFAESISLLVYLILAKKELEIRLFDTSIVKIIFSAASMAAIICWFKIYITDFIAEIIILPIIGIIVYGISLYVMKEELLNNVIRILAGKIIRHKHD